MRKANIPSEGIFLILIPLSQLTQVIVIWNDIDLYQSVRDFTFDPLTYPGETMRAFRAELVSLFRCKAKLLSFIPLPGFEPSEVHAV